MPNDTLHIVKLPQCTETSLFAELFSECKIWSRLQHEFKNMNQSIEYLTWFFHFVYMCGTCQIKFSLLNPDWFGVVLKLTCTCTILFYVCLSCFIIKYLPHPSYNTQPVVFPSGHLITNYYLFLF